MSNVPSRRSNAELNRARAAVFIFGAAAVVLVVPAASAYGEWQHALHYGWPGPYRSSIAEANGGETIVKAQIWGLMSLVVLAGAAIASGFAARTAGQRVWLVVLTGVIVTVAMLAVVAVLLTPPLESSG
ncbi:hypothetical protein ACF1AJ_02820 [Leifsonia sp. NPDC014704]|uniref:hypothetical protein n=1 Tax=Leifsonia sp. NPDC014704 TaxID=3364123 RepID=UPI0036F48641